MIHFWFDPAAPESGAMAAALVGLSVQAHSLDSDALRQHQGVRAEGLAPAVRRSRRQALARRPRAELPPAQPGTPEDALLHGVFALPAAVSEGRVHRDLGLRELRAELGTPPPPLPQADETLPVDVYLDLADPASFLAAIRVERLCGRGLAWHLVQGRTLRAGFGVPDPVRDGTELERAWWRDHLDREAPRPLDWGALDIRPTFAARALLQLGFDDPRARVLLLHLLHCLWLEGRDLSDRDVLGRTLGELQLDASLVDDADPATLRAETEAAQAAGVFTTPTFVVRGERFVGLDALDDAARAARLPRGLVTLGGR